MNLALFLWLLSLFMYNMTMFSKVTIIKRIKKITVL